MLSRRMLVALTVAGALAAGLILAGGRAPLEERLLHLQLQAVLPEQAAALRDESLLVQQAVLELAVADPVLATKAWLALERYPAMAREILQEYGADPAFRLILREYGELVLPPIHFFMSNESLALSVRKQIADGLRAARQRWQDAELPMQPVPAMDAGLDARERGYYAIRFIAADGHGFLGQFVVAEDGRVLRVQSERLVEAASDFFTGGIRRLETRLRLGQEVRASDAAWAALDLAMAVGALKVLRMGRGATTLSAGGRATEPATAALGSTLLRGSRIGARVARMGAPVALAYIVVRHPSLLHSAFARIAEIVGIPTWLGQLVGWTIVLWPLLLLLSWLLKPLAGLLGISVTALRWCDARLRGGM